MGMYGMELKLFVIMYKETYIKLLLIKFYVKQRI